MQLTLLIAFIGALVASVTAQTLAPTPLNTQQQNCAKPPSGCGSQVKPQSCINWHGCSWSCGANGKLCAKRSFNDGTSGLGCKSRNPTACCKGLSQADCDTKPFRVPTTSPTPPTIAPTKSPIFVCRVPQGDCPSQTTSTACNSFNGCKWNTNSNICQKGGCSGTPMPTASPTTCNDIPSGGCRAATTTAACGAFSCCKWQSNFCVSLDTPPPPACGTLPKATCKKRKDCRVSGRKCIVRGSQG